MMLKLLEEDKNKEPKATNTLRRGRKKTKSSRSFSKAKTVDLDTSPVSADKSDNKNHQLSELEKHLEVIANKNTS